MKAKPYNCHPHTTSWAVLKLELAFARLLWEIVRAFKINWIYGIPDKGQLSVDRG